MLARLVLEEPQEFRAWNEQFSTQRTAGVQLPTLDEAIDAEVIDAEEAGSLMHGIGEPLRLFGGSFQWRLRDRRFHRSKTLTLSGTSRCSAPAVERATSNRLLMPVGAEESDLGAAHNAGDTFPNHVAKRHKRD